MFSRDKPHGLQVGARDCFLNPSVVVVAMHHNNPIFLPRFAFHVKPFKNLNDQEKTFPTKKKSPRWQSRAYQVTQHNGSKKTRS